MGRVWSIFLLLLFTAGVLRLGLTLLLTLPLALLIGLTFPTDETVRSCLLLWIGLTVLLLIVSPLSIKQTCVICLLLNPGRLAAFVLFPVPFVNVPLDVILHSSLDGQASHAQRTDHTTQGKCTQSIFSCCYLSSHSYSSHSYDHPASSRAVLY